MAVRTVEITAEDQWTDSISPTDKNYKDFLNISIGGSDWVATISLQRNFDDEAADVWHTVKKFGTPKEDRVCEPEEGVKYRIGCAVGDFTSVTSGETIPLRLSKSE